MFESTRSRFLVFAALVAALALLGACAPSPDAGSDAGAPEADPLAVGNVPPEVTLTGVDGQPTTVTSLTAGKVAIVDLWATWCAPCVAAMPHLDEMYKTHADKGFVVVGVMSDGNAISSGAKVLEDDKYKVSYPMLLDDNSEKVAAAWGHVLGYPTVSLLDRDGKVVETWLGTGDPTAVEEAVAKLFEEEAAAAAGEGAEPAPAEETTAS